MDLQNDDKTNEGKFGEQNDTANLRNSGLKLQEENKIMKSDIQGEEKILKNDITLRILDKMSENKEESIKISNQFGSNTTEQNKLIQVKVKRNKSESQFKKENSKDNVTLMKKTDLKPSEVIFDEMEKMINTLSQPKENKKNNSTSLDRN